MSWGSDSVGQVLVWYTQITVKQPCWYTPANSALSQERQENQLHRGFKTSLGCTGSCFNSPPHTHTQIVFKLLSFTFHSCTPPLYIIVLYSLKLYNYPKIRLQALHHVLKALVSSENNMLRFWLIDFWHALVIFKDALLCPSFLFLWVSFVWDLTCLSTTTENPLLPLPRVLPR